jgi:hypothetical protein
MGKKPQTLANRNPVAKFAGRFNRAATFRDRSKYRRNAKHKGREPFSLSIVCGR